MNIIIDITRLVRRSIKGGTLTGIDRVTMAYVRYYGHKAKALVRWCGRNWILSRRQSEALFAWLASPRSAIAARFILIKGILSNRNKRGEDWFLLNTGHVGLSQSDYLKLVKKQGIKPIFVVHDLIPITYPEYCSAGEDRRYREKMNFVLALAAGVIANSETTEHELRQYALQAKQPLPQTTVALLAPGMLLSSPGKRPIDKPYFVILSTIEPRKNHLLVLQIWRKLFQCLGKNTPHLFVIGRRGWECENILDLLERSELLKEVVTEISSCPDPELVTYIYHSQALLFPSFTEGYGLPLIEAFTLGIPVIASDLPIFREIAGEIPEYIEPLDGKQWEGRIREYAKPDSVDRAAQVKNISHFKVPTWAEHFRRVDSFLSALKVRHPERSEGSPE